MKQGKHYLSIVIWIFLAAIVAYFGYNLATSLYTPLTTTTAVEYEAGAGYYATGFVVRDESVIRSSYAISVLTVSEGQRVAAGGQVDVYKRQAPKLLLTIFASVAVLTVPSVPTAMGRTVGTVTDILVAAGSPPMLPSAVLDLSLIHIW